MVNFSNHKNTFFKIYINSPDLDFSGISSSFDSLTLIHIRPLLPVKAAALYLIMNAI